MAASPTIAAGAARKLFTKLVELGVDPAPVATELGLRDETLADPDARIALATLHALWEVVLGHMPRPDAAIHVAQDYSPGDYGLVGFVAMNAATLGEALGHAVRFVRLWTDEPVMRLREDGTLEMDRSRLPDRPGLRCTTEAAPAEIVVGARLLTQTHLVPRSVSFTHPAPHDVCRHEAFFGCEVRFDQPATAVVFPREHLELHLPKADPQLGAYVRAMADAALEQRREPADEELDRMRQIVADELQRGVPTLERIARHMATSTRTLRRRLETRGSSFRELLDETRADLARGYVRDRRVPLTEVAFLLGFSNSSAFHRAFKRWTDTTPKEWRAKV